MCSVGWKSRVSRTIIFLFLAIRSGLEPLHFTCCSRLYTFHRFFHRFPLTGDIKLFQKDSWMGVFVAGVPVMGGRASVSSECRDGGSYSEVVSSAVRQICDWSWTDYFLFGNLFRCKLHFFFFHIIYNKQTTILLFLSMKWLCYDSYWTWITSFY